MSKQKKGFEVVVTESDTPTSKYVLATTATSQQLDMCLQEFGFQALTIEEFIQSGIEDLNQALMRDCRAGVAFWAAQEALRSPEYAGRTQTFEEWIADEGLSKPRVYESIRIAKFYARLPDENRAKVLAIGKKQALLLASLPQEIIDSAAESGNDLIEKADLMTVAELKAEIKDLKKREKNYDAEIERKDSLIRRLSDDKKRVTDFLPRTEEIRAECMAQQLGAELALNSLQKMFEEVRADDPDLPEWRMQLEQIWVAAHIAASRALDVLSYMHDHVREGEMPSRVMAGHILLPAEAQRWMLDAKLIENRVAAEAAAREEQRDAAKPRGPGRPKGSSTKSGE